MNALVWFIALIASIALSYLFFVEFTGAVFTMLGWLSIGLVFLCVVETLISMYDDGHDENKRFGF